MARILNGHFGFEVRTLEFREARSLSNHPHGSCIPASLPELSSITNLDCTGLRVSVKVLMLANMIEVCKLNTEPRTPYSL